MNIFLTVLLSLFNILGWSLNPFLIKHLLKQISPFAFTVLGYLIPLPLFLIISIFIKKEILNKSTKFYIITSIIIIITFLCRFINAFLLKSYNANIVSAIINPLVIFISAIIGAFFFEEPFTKQMWIGLVFIIIGLIIFILGRKNINKG